MYLSPIIPIELFKSGYVANKKNNRGECCCVGGAIEVESATNLLHFGPLVHLGHVVECYRN